MGKCRSRAKGLGHSVLSQEQDNSFQGVWQSISTVEAVKYVNSDLGAAGRQAGLIRTVWPVVPGLDVMMHWPRRPKSENDEFSGLIVLYSKRRSAMILLKPRHVKGYPA